MMSSSEANVVYARPVRLVKDRDKTPMFPNHSTAEPKKTKRVTIVPKANRIIDIENSSPPPRPPPPRPARVPKHPHNDIPKPVHETRPHPSHELRPHPSHELRPHPSHEPRSHPSHEPKPHPSHEPRPHPSHEQRPHPSHESRPHPSHEPRPHTSHHNQTTPEPKPLTRTNVTSHDRLWQDDTDEDSGLMGVLSPPMKHITPETAEEMWRNFDPLDVIDSTSDHSDSSADTMIMMTTEEEKNNKEKIDSSLQEFNSRKMKSDLPNTNMVKVNIQNKKNLHIQFSDTNGIVKVPVHLTNGVSYPDSESTSKVTPLHVRTTTDSNGSSPESVGRKAHSQYSSPNDSPDDGYGTNSSSGTLSSPFSSSFNSSDLENSCNGSQKKVILPNGAIKPNSVRESWAVKRKQRMIEAQDTSVQDQLRELAIIEEEGSGNSPTVLRAQDNKYHHQAKNRYGLNVTGFSRDSGENKTDQKPTLASAKAQVARRSRQNRVDSQSSLHVVNVSQNDLDRESGELYVISSDNDTISQPVSGVSARVPHHSRPSNEITAPPPVPPPYNDVMGANRDRGRGDNSGFNSHRTERDSQRSQENRTSSGNVSGEFSSLPSGSSSMPVLVGGERNQPTHMGSGNQPTHMGSGNQPTHMGSGNQPTHMGSGKIYVSPSGDEGFYSLNRSSRSTSIASFDPLSDPADNAPEAPSSPKSPLEILSGDLLEKWTDMDRNYRNYYGFGAGFHKYSRTDSKVNYFQEKKINNIYGHDNYYQPSTYGQEPNVGQEHVSGQTAVHQGTQRDSQNTGVSETDSASSRTSSMRNHKTGKEGEKSKHKLFQILPNMFRNSNKKQSAEKSNKNKPKSGILRPPVQQESPSPASLEYEQDSEYMNISDIPRYSIANVLQAEKLAQGEYVPIESLQKRPVFASSKDIQKLFSKQNQSFDSLHNPGSQRHSFHAMPLSYRHVVNSVSEDEDMRPRAQSTSATMRSQHKTSVENRMAVIARKNAMVMNQARQGGNLAASSVGNLSLHSNNSNKQLNTSRTRLDSGSSGGGDPKLSTLV